MADLRLGIDMDGVLADFNAGWTWRYNRDFADRLERPLSAADVVAWNAPVFLTHFDRMDEFWDWAEACAEGRSLFHGLDPYPAAIDTLAQLDRDGHEVVIVTTKPHYAHADTHDWLERHGVPAAEIHIVDDKTVVDCDVYLDDADHNLRALRQVRRSALVCRYVRPWNDPVPGVVDVADWSEFREIVARRRTG